MANVRGGGQGSSLLRSRVTYGSFYLRMGAMCEYRPRAELKVGHRLRECFKLVDAEVVSMSRNKIHQTWSALFSPPLHVTFACVTIPH